MSSAISNIINSISNGFRGQYRPLSTNSASNQLIPGSYPLGDEEQDTNIDTRNRKGLDQWTQLLVNCFHYVLVKPLIIVMLVLFRMLAKLVAVIFNKEPDNDEVIHDPIDKVNKFVRSLEDNLTAEQYASANNLPAFFQGSYTQALYMATNRGKFLFVYLTNANNENSQQIFQKIITNSQFIDIFQNNPDIIIWGGDLTNPEAYQLANSLNVTKFPFLGLLCLTRTTTMSPDGPIKTAPKISLISKIQGDFKSNASLVIQKKFRSKIVQYEEELSLIRNELRDRFMSQVLVKQQELKFQTSLNKDRIKKRQKHQEQLFKQYLVYKLGIIRQWPQENSPDMAKIAIKLLDGTRTTYYFPANEKVECIFTYVELVNRGYFNDANITSTLSEYEFHRTFDDFEPVYKFKLASPVPPRISLNDMKESQIMDVPSIYPNGVLIVESV